jgi:hypothetical protein
MDKKTESDFSHLKKLICNQFQTEISSRSDCERLALEIQNRTGYSISYNTLRRFFGLAGVKSKNAPSNSTLKILSNYCGYKNFERIAFGEVIQNVSIEEFYKMLLHFQTSQKIDNQMVLIVFNQIKDNPNLYIFFYEVVNLAIRIKDFDFMCELFNFEELFENKSYMHIHIYYTMISVGLYVRSSKQKIILWDIWAGKSLAQSFYFELFVDMDNLIINHYHALEKYAKHKKTPESKLFVGSLLFYRCFMLDQKKEMLRIFEQLKKIEIDYSIHPIPIARFLTCKLLLQKDMQNDKMKQEIIDEFNEMISKIRKHKLTGKFTSFFQIWLLEGLVLSRNFVLAQKLIFTLEKYGKEDHTFYNNGEWERYKIYKAYVLCYYQNVTGAKMISQKIDPAKFHAFSKQYDMIFYQVLNYKISGDLDSLKQAEGIAKKIQYNKLIDILL